MKAASVTTVGTGAWKANVWFAAVMSPQYWRRRMSVRIWVSTGEVE
jgi:hypothetical protein